MSTHAAQAVSSRPPPPLSRPMVADGGLRERVAALRHPLGPWLRFLAVVGAAVVLLVAAATVSTGLPLIPLLAYAVGFLAVCGNVLASAAACPSPRPWALWIAAIPAAVLLSMSLSPAPADSLRDAASVTACLLICACLLGGVVGRAIEHPGQLIFVAIVSSAADVYSVFHSSGPSHAIAQSEVALSVMALPWPMLGTPAIEPLLGAGDVVFTALYLHAARRHGLSLRRTLIALSLAYLVTMAVVIALQAAVPALPSLGLAMVLAHPAARRPAVQDRARGWLAVAVVLAVVALLFLR